MKTLRHLAVAVGCCAAVFSGTSAFATTVTFDSLGGNNGDTFVSYSESGFTVSKTSGSGCVAKIFGNPFPDVYGGPVCDNGSLGVYSVTGAGLFEFDSIDLAANNGTLSYSIVGLLGSNPLWTLTDSLGGPTGVFSTILSQSSTLVDSLEITFRTAGTSFNFDNIVLTEGSVPEPASLALLGLALAGLAASRRRKP